MTNLGRFYNHEYIPGIKLNNFGEKNVQKSFEYFNKAYLNEDMKAPRLLGDFYKNGIYVEKNEKKAFELYYDAMNKRDDWYYVCCGLLFK